MGKNYIRNLGRPICKASAGETKERVIKAAAAIGFLIAGVTFWKMVAAFMWACYYAGIPM